MRPGSPNPAARSRAAAGQPSPAMAAAMSGAVDLAAVKARSDAQQRAASAPPPAAGDVAVTVTAETLQSAVLDRSFQVPVLLNVVSSRYAESTTYTPTLEALAREAAGAWVLATVDIDTAPDIARSLQVQAVPTVFAVIKGQLVPGFEGALPEDQLREFLAAVLQAGQQQGLTAPVPAEGDGPAAAPEAPVDPRFAAAEQALDDGDYDLAAERYRTILATEPANADAQAALVQVGLLARLATLPADALARAEQSPDDVGAVLGGADALFATGRVEEAFTALLAAFRRFAADERDAVRTRMVEFFEVLGPDDPRVPPARRQLAAALF